MRGDYNLQKSVKKEKKREEVFSGSLAVCRKSLSFPFGSASVVFSSSHSFFPMPVRSLLIYLSLPTPSFHFSLQLFTPMPLSTACQNLLLPLIYFFWLLGHCLLFDWSTFFTVKAPPFKLNYIVMMLKYDGNDSFDH